MNETSTSPQPLRASSEPVGVHPGRVGRDLVHQLTGGRIAEFDDLRVPRQSDGQLRKCGATGCAAASMKVQLLSARIPHRPDVRIPANA